MSLLKCFECGEMVSEYAESCPNCGCPVEIIKSNVKIEEQISVEINIDAQLESIKKYYKIFKGSPSLYKCNLYWISQDIRKEIDSIDFITSKCNKDEKKIINDKLAQVIVEIIMDSTDYRTWDTYKAFYEFIDFKNISEETFKLIADKIYEKITVITYNDDGSSGNSEYIKLWYPIYQILTYAPEYIREPIAEQMSMPNVFNGKKIQDIQAMVNRHLKDETIVNKTQEQQTINLQLPKVSCPTCSSTNVKKIGLLSRAISTGFFGIASSKIGKQWHCNNCNTDF